MLRQWNRDPKSLSEKSVADRSLWMLDVFTPSLILQKQNGPENRSPARQGSNEEKLLAPEPSAEPAAKSEARTKVEAGSVISAPVRIRIRVPIRVRVGITIRRISRRCIIPCARIAWIRRSAIAWTRARHHAGLRIVLARRDIPERLRSVIGRDRHWLVDTESQHRLRSDICGTPARQQHTQDADCGSRARSNRGSAPPLGGRAEGCA